MHPLLAHLIERAAIRITVRPGRFDAAPPPPAGARPPVPPVAASVLAAPEAAVELPGSAPLSARELRVPSLVQVSAGAENDLTGVVLRPRGRPARAVLLVPGWMVSFRGYFVWLGRKLARRGAVVVLLDLPAHFARTPPGAANGVRFFSGDAARNALYLRQALSDARSLLAGLALEMEGGAPIVACGSSLGAWVAGAAASGRRGVAAVLVTPAADMAAILRVSPLLLEVRAALGRAGYDPEQVGAETAALALAALPPPGLGAAILGARLDEVIPAEQSERLAAAWRSPLEWLPVGHMTPYVSPGFLRRLAAAIEAWDARGDSRE